MSRNFRTALVDDVRVRVVDGGLSPSEPLPLGSSVPAPPAPAASGTG